MSFFSTYITKVILTSSLSAFILKVYLDVAILSMVTWPQSPAHAKLILEGFLDRLTHTTTEQAAVLDEFESENVLGGKMQV